MFRIQMRGLAQKRIGASEVVYRYTTGGCEQSEEHEEVG